jgi:hypothetical protein
MRVTIVEGLPQFVAESTGPVAIYLDNDAIIELAKGPSERRDRFLQTLTAGGTFLFSATNAIEVGGPLGKSSATVRSFLGAIGANWIPLEMDFHAVMLREREGHQAPAVSQAFMEAYFKQRAFEMDAGGQILDLTADRFFSLSPVVDWARESRDRLRSRTGEIANGLRTMVSRLRASYEQGEPLDKLLPPITWDRRRPATFVCTYLLRTMVREAKAFQLTDHDGMDFCHAVVATAYGSIATLDKHWKRRVETLPTPNEAAVVFYRPELDEMVDHFAGVVARLNASRSAV